MPQPGGAKREGQAVRMTPSLAPDRTPAAQPTSVGFSRLKSLSVYHESY